MLILASQSPRRKELLKRVVPAFTCEPAGIDERALPLLPPPAYVQSLAKAKGEAVLARHPGADVLACDTMVAFNGQLLGKPRDYTAAQKMLQSLSGQTHQVYSGLYLNQAGQVQTQVVATSVTFWPLSTEEITDYLAAGEYRDKAGAYGIQGQGALLVQGICGDYYNVVGLPIATLARMLKRK